MNTPSAHGLILALVIPSLIAFSVAGVAGGTPHTSEIVIGQPTISVLAPDNRLLPGERVDLRLFLVNAGEVTQHGSREFEALVQTARATTVRLDRGDAPITVRTGETPVGTISEGDTVPTTFNVQVWENATPGTYELPVRIRYEHTRVVIQQEDDPTQFRERVRTVTHTVPIVVQKRAQFNVVNVSSDVRVGGTGTVTLAIENIGRERIRDSTVIIRSTDSELTFGTGASSTDSFTGSWAPSETKRVAVEASIAEDAIRRNYSLTATVQYRDTDGIRQQSEQLVTGIFPRPKLSFEVVNVSTTAEIAGSGILVLELRNAGSVLAYDATVTAVSTDAEITFPTDAGQAQSFAGDWHPGEVKRLRYRIDVGDTAVRRAYPLQAIVSYENADGTEQPPRTLRTAVEPRPEQTFALRNVSSDLRIAETGRITARLENTGATSVRDVVVTLNVRRTNMTPLSVEYPIGRLAPNASAPIRFTVDVPEIATDGVQPIAFVVEYRNGLNDVRQSDRLDASIEIRERRRAFGLEPVNATFPIDSTRPLVIRVTNNRDERLTDITAVISLEEPLSSDDLAAFVSALDPGESRLVAFEIEVSNDAIPKDYPVSIEFTYEDAEGLTRDAGPYRIGLTVTKQPGGGFPLLPLAAVATAIAIGIGWWWRRR